MWSLVTCRRLSAAMPSTSKMYIDYTFSAEISKKFENVIEFKSMEFMNTLYRDAQSLLDKKKAIDTTRRKLYRAFQSQGMCIVPIGSVSNQLLSSQSDLDVVLLPSEDTQECKNFMKKFNSNQGFKVGYMENVKYLIKRNKLHRSVVIMLPSTRIPLVQFKSKEMVQVDIQFGNIGPIRSSLFVRTCVEFDERVRPIILWLTKKFEQFGILNSKAGMFSKYHVNSLVLHFLQTMPYPVLPDIIKLSPWLSLSNDYHNAVRVLGKQGSLYVPCNDVPNEMNIGAIIVQMIDYFSQIDFDKCAIDTRGNLLNRSDYSLSLELVDLYFAEPTCRVGNASNILKNLFASQRKLLENGNFNEVFV